jgi:hypothetical protein
MQLREHPLMFYRGYPMWPPIWVGLGATKGQSAQGEVGRLKEVRCYPGKPRRVFLVIDHESEQYTGCLLFDDDAFSQRICSFLKGYYGRLTRFIGDLDVPLDLGLAGAYRKASECQTWHFCSNCSHWPEDNYEIQAMAPQNGQLCNECKALQQEQNCRNP